MDRVDYIKCEKEDANTMETCSGYRNSECFICSYKNQCNFKKDVEKGFVLINPFVKWDSNI